MNTNLHIVPGVPQLHNRSRPARGRVVLLFSPQEETGAGAPATETFTCTLTVNFDGTGSAVCPLDDPVTGAPPVETFDFVLEDKARAFRLVGTTPGVVVMGSGKEQ